MNSNDPYRPSGSQQGSSSQQQIGNQQNGLVTNSTSSSQQIMMEDQTEGLTKKELESEKKDIELGELLELIGDWKPVIPDEVTDFYLQKAGFETDDPRVKRLLSLAAQRFVSSIASDAFQYARTRTAAGPAGRKDGLTGTATKNKDKTKTVLTMEDLSSALTEYGIDAGRAAYYL